MFRWWWCRYFIVRQFYTAVFLVLQKHLSVSFAYDKGLSLRIYQLKCSFTKMFVFALRWLICLCGNFSYLMAHTHSMRIEPNRIGFFFHFFHRFFQYFQVNNNNNNCKTNTDTLTPMRKNNTKSWQMNRFVIAFANQLSPVSSSDIRRRCKAKQRFNCYKQMALINFEYLS